MVLSKLKAELSSFYARGNSSYIRLIPTYFTYFWSCFKHLQVNKKHENSFEDSEYLFNLNPPQPPPPPSVELLIFFHFWHQSRFLWLLENGEHLGRTCLYQLCTSEFLSHLYSSQSQYKCVIFCKSCFWEHPVICIFFFSMPVSILWFVLINHIFLQVHWFVSNVFFFLSGNVSLWVLSIQQCQANLQYCHTVPKGIMPSYHNYNKPKHSARVITNYLQQEATYNCFASTCSWS